MDADRITRWTSSRGPDGTEHAGKGSEFPGALIPRAVFCVRNAPYNDDRRDGGTVERTDGGPDGRGRRGRVVRDDGVKRSGGGVFRSDRIVRRSNIKIPLQRCARAQVPAYGDREDINVESFRETIINVYPPLRYPRRIALLPHRSVVGDLLRNDDAPNGVGGRGDATELRRDRACVSSAREIIFAIFLPFLLLRNLLYRVLLLFPYFRPGKYLPKYIFVYIYNQKENFIILLKLTRGA